jgi:AraC family transcriptional regulator
MYSQNTAVSKPGNASIESSSAHAYGRTGELWKSGTAFRDRCAGEGIDGRVTVHQLRSVVADLVVALNQALNDECDTAEECLRRAESVLDSPHSISLPVAAVQGGLAPWQLRRVTAYVEANLEKTIRNTELALLARLSPCHFNRAFRNSIGDPPHFYIVRRRIERAQRMMLSTESSLSQIAADCGLADQAHLTRLFRRLAGESPAAWRRARMSPRM